MEITFSVIVVSYNTRALLLKCLKSVEDTVGCCPYEIIVIDNGSPDGSADAVEDIDSDRIIVIRNTENFGFAAACNQGIKKARGRYLLFLNSDAFILERTIETLLEFLEEHPEASAAGPKVLNPDGTLQNKGYFFPSLAYSFIVLFGLNRLFPDRMKRRLFPRFYWDENEARPVDYLEGSCIMIKRDVLDQVGLFPEEYFMYFEEEEWFYRAAKRGYLAWYVPAAKIIHVGKASPIGDRNAVFDRSMLLFFRRNVGHFRGSAIAGIQLLSTVLDSVISMFSGQQKKAALKHQFGQQLFLLNGLLRRRNKGDSF